MNALRDSARESIGHVLFVTDRLFMACLIGASLEESGLELTTVSDARTAVEIAQGSHLDLCLLDYAVPANNAKVLAQQLGALRPRMQLIGLGNNRCDAPVDLLLEAPFTATDVIQVVLASLGKTPGIPH